MNKNIFQRLLNVMAVVTLIAALGACGNKDENGSGNPGGTTTGSTTGTTTGSTTGSVQGANINLYTSYCNASVHTCPDNQTPYQTKVKLEQWYPNGWYFVANVSTGTIGNVIIQVPAGKYRLSAAAPDAGTTATTQVTPQVIEVTSGQTLTTQLNFVPID